MHHVETMAYANQVPWHGLGTSVPADISVDDMLVKAGLDWEVERVPIYTGDNRDEPVPEHLAIRRATDKLVYDIVSPRWKPVQNREILSFFRNWAEAGDAKIETAGSLRQGRQVWALANLGTGWKLNGTDEVKGYVLLVGSHESGKATVLRTTSVRVVCANTLAASLWEKAKSEVRWTHASDFDPDAARERLAISRDAISAMERAARTLQKLKLDLDKKIEVLQPVFQPQMHADKLIRDNQHLSPLMRSILWSDSKAPGAVPGSGWGLINGVTHTLDHRTNTRTPDGRFYAAQLGHHASNKQKVLASLLELAA
jgi:phage/plasmid-like protein (TIGR03299 family)